MNFEKPLNIHNRFDFSVIDEKTGDIVQTAIAENVVCATLYNKVLSDDPQYFKTIVVGTGTSTPNSSDSRLGNYAGTVSSDETWESSGVVGHSLKDSFSFTKTYTIGTSELNGKKLSEVGIGSSSVIYTHALLRSQSGNITIDKTDRVRVEIKATIYVTILSSSNDKYISIPCNEYTKLGTNDNIIPSPIVLWAAGLADFPKYLKAGGAISDNQSISEYPSYKSGTVSYDVSKKQASVSYTFKNTDLAHKNRSCNHITLYGYENAHYSPAISFFTGGNWFKGVTSKTLTATKVNLNNKEYSTLCPFIKNATVKVNSNVRSATVNERLDVTDVNSRDIGLYVISNKSKDGEPNYTGDVFSRDDNTTPVKFGMKSQYEQFEHGKDIFIYNPYYGDVKISEIEDIGNGLTAYYSNDFSTWYQIQSSTLSGDAKTAKYYKFNISGTYTTIIMTQDMTGWVPLTTGSELCTGNIQFSTALSPSDVVTVTFDSDTVVLSENDTFEFTATITIG